MCYLRLRESKRHFYSCPQRRPLAIYVYYLQRPMYLTVQTLAWIVSYGWLVLPGVYLLFVYLKRHKRARSLEKEYAPAGRASFSSLTTNQAQAILKDLTELEFPKVFGYSIVFALFKVCGGDNLC